MMYNQFEILIASPSDREKLVAEIWRGKLMVAEISQEEERLSVVFYARVEGEECLLDLEETAKALLIAANHLRTPISPQRVKEIVSVVADMMPPTRSG